MATVVTPYGSIDTVTRNWTPTPVRTDTLSDNGEIGVEGGAIAGASSSFRAQALSNTAYAIAVATDFGAAFISGGNVVATASHIPLGLLAQSGGFSVASSTRLVVPTAGKYLIQFNVIGAVNDATSNVNLDVMLRKNGSTDLNRTACMRAGTSTSREVPVAGFHVATLAANDYLELQNLSGANLTTSSTYNGNIIVKRIG